MRPHLALAAAMLLSLTGCVTSGGGSSFGIYSGTGYGAGRAPLYYDPYPYPFARAPYGFYPYSRFGPSPFHGWGGHRACWRDRRGRAIC